MLKKNAHPLVSIIIPIYNVENYIEECINSVINQSYKNIEIILVDDVSEDSSIDIAKHTLKTTTCTWNLFYHASNKGLAAARNTGVHHAKGEYIFFLDSDDFIDIHCIQTLVSTALRTDADMIYGSYSYICENKIFSCPFSYQKEIECSDEPFKDHISKKAYSLACNRLIKSDFYKKSGVYFKEGIVHEDESWSFSLALRARKICFIKNITYYYRQRLGSISNPRTLNLHRLESIYFNLKHYSKESVIFNVFNISSFQSYYAKEILHLCKKIMESNLRKTAKLDFLNKIFTELSLPSQGFKQIRFFSLFKRLAFLLPNYRWLSLFFYFKKIKHNIIHKTN